MNHYGYETTNLINGKKYIGKRSCDCDIEEDSYLGSGTYFKRALLKYGRENFKKEILKICDSEIMAFEWEIKFIEKVEAYKNCNYYNIARGGNGGFNVFAGKSQEELEQWKKNMSESRKGRIITKEWMEKILKTRKERGLGIGEKNGMYGKSGVNNPVSKPIVMFDYKGNIIKEFECIREANGYLENDRSTSIISRVCIEKQGTAYGHLWLFKCDYLNFVNNKKFEQWLKDMNSRYVERNKKFNKSSILYNSEPVYKLDRDSLVILYKYKSIKDAVLETGIPTSQISRNCKHSCNTAGGYSWIFAKEYNMLDNEDLKKLYSHKYTPCSKEVYEKRKKKVICVTTGEIFDGIIDAIKHFSLCKGAKIEAVCKGKRKSTGKHPKTGEPLKWMYYDDYLKIYDVKLKNNLN